MRSLDTNILVRYIAADDPKQLSIAEAAIEECRKNHETLFLSIIVLCELVWVLDRRYQLSKPEVIRTLDEILDMDQIQLEHDELVRRSLEAYRNGKGSFSDYVIREVSDSHGCRDVITFDRNLKHSAGFTVLG